MNALLVDFTAVLAAHGFLLETQDKHSKTFQQATGSLTATWDIRHSGIYIWLDHGAQEGGSRVTYVGEARTEAELEKILEGT